MFHSNRSVPKSGTYISLDDDDNNNNDDDVGDNVDAANVGDDYDD